MTSKKESILANLKTTCEGITIAAGYNLTVAHVERDLKHFEELPESQFPALFVVDSDEVINGEIGHYQRNDFTPSIVGYIRKTTEVSTELNKLEEDVKKALMVDITRGGYAVRTIITNVFKAKGFLAPYAAFEIALKVDYRSTFENP